MGKPLPDLRLALLQGIQAHLDRRVVFPHVGTQNLDAGVQPLDMGADKVLKQRIDALLISSGIMPIIGDGFQILEPFLLAPNFGTLLIDSP